MGHWEGWTRGPTVGIPRRFDPSPDQASALASAPPGAAHDDPLQRKPLPRPRFLPAATRPIATLALAAVLAGGALPAPVVAGDVAGTDPRGPLRAARHHDLRGSGCGRGPVAPAAPVVTGDDSTAVPELHPSIAYEQAMAHEHDRIDFKPGGRVTVGFTPRARDRWPIDGRPPAALPAGRATGREMAASPQGSLWATRDGVIRRGQRRERTRPTAAGPALLSTAPAAGRPSTRPASPTPRRPPRPTSTSPPPPASAARCSASCPTGSCRARRPSSTTTSCRPSPTSRSAPIAHGNLRKKDRRRHEHDRLGRLDELAA